MSIILGNAPPEGAKRDAVHVAVVPVRISGGVCPGDRVVIVDRAATPMLVASAMGDEYDGVIDPFRYVSEREYYVEGEAWMLLHPRRVGPVRHDFDMTPALADDIDPQDEFCCKGQRY